MLSEIPYRDWPEEQKERKRAAERKWRLKHREKALEDKRKREAVYRQDPEFRIRKSAADTKSWLKRRHGLKWLISTRRAHLKSKFGITLEKYDEMFKAQNGVCAICKQPETASRAGKIKLLSVDHNHGTKQIRGLLCDNCNKALGCMQDEIERLQSAINYLNRYQ